MVLNILLGIFYILLTCVTHSIATKIVIRIVRSASSLDPNKHNFRILIWIDLVILLMIFVSIIESLIWATGYISMGAILDFEEALYFSIVTYTTLGYGDITLGEEWRLMASLQAANGIIMFGWSTAIVVSTIQNMYFSVKKR